MARVVAFLTLLLLTAAPLPSYTPTLATTPLNEQRARLIAWMFDSAQLPATLPDESLTVTTANGEESHITRLTPLSPNGAALIYHTGHGGYTTDDQRAAALFVQAHYTVYIVHMPAPPHERFATMSAVGSPARYFLEPTIALVNWLEAAEVERIYMVGLSGGGWTTTLAAAIDTRIAASYPVAGTIPLGLRYRSRDAGDWEQALPELYALASYEDLYALGSEGRRQLQIRNVWDSCCFAGENVSYAPAVQSRAPSFDVWLDYSHHAHITSEWSVRIIIGDLELIRR